MLSKKQPLYVSKPNQPIRIIGRDETFAYCVKITRQIGHCSFTLCLSDNKGAACLIRCFSYAEGEIPSPMAVTLTLAPFNELLTHLVNDAPLTLCIFGVTAVRHVFKITTLCMVLVFSVVWRLIRSPSTVNVPNYFKMINPLISWGYVRPCPQMFIALVLLIYSLNSKNKWGNIQLNDLIVGHKPLLNLRTHRYE